MPTRRLAFALTLPLTLGACGDDGGPSADTDASTGTTDASMSATMSATNPTMTDASATLDPDSTGDDPATTEPGTTTDEPGTTTDAPGTTTDDTGTDDTGTADTGSSGESGGALEICLGMIDEGDACGECACNECLPELSACEDDEGCTAIRMCAQEAMCSGLGCLRPCGDVIDANGGIIGMSAAIAQALGGCIDMSCDAC